MERTLVCQAAYGANNDSSSSREDLVSIACLSDGHVAFLNSVPIVASYLNDRHARHTWQDGALQRRCSNGLSLHNKDIA